MSKNSKNTMSNRHEDTRKARERTRNWNKYLNKNKKSTNLHLPMKICTFLSLFN